jgi:hypothetical protein
MHVKIQMLRRNGVLLSGGSPTAWIDGLMETEPLNVGGGRMANRLVLRGIRSSSGGGAVGPGEVIAALHQPTIVDVGHNAMKIRGIEEVDLDGQRAAVVQEWRVSH